MSAEWQQFAEAGASVGQLSQSGRSVSQHGMQVEAAGRLIRCPRGLHIVGIQPKLLPDQPLGYLGGCQIHPVQSSKQLQQI